MREEGLVKECQRRELIVCLSPQSAAQLQPLFLSFSSTVLTFNIYLISTLSLHLCDYPLSSIKIRGTNPSILSIPFPLLCCYCCDHCSRVPSTHRLEFRQFLSFLKFRHIFRGRAPYHIQDAEASHTRPEITDRVVRHHHSKLLSRAPIPVSTKK
jgi:hypothetical protein